jgi:MYXO-CTERM domain-containing protein
VGDTVYVTIGNNGNDSFDASVIDFQLVSVPEPSAALLGGLGMLALLRRRRA